MSGKDLFFHFLQKLRWVENRNTSEKTLNESKTDHVTHVNTLFLNGEVPAVLWRLQTFLAVWEAAPQAGLAEDLFAPSSFFLFWHTP